MGWDHTVVLPDGAYKEQPLGTEPSDAWPVSKILNNGFVGEEYTCGMGR